MEQTQHEKAAAFRAPHEGEAFIGQAGGRFPLRAPPHLQLKRTDCFGGLIHEYEHSS